MSLPELESNRIGNYIKDASQEEIKELLTYFKVEDLRHEVERREVNNKEVLKAETQIISQAILY